MKTPECDFFFSIPTVNPVAQKSLIILSLNRFVLGSPSTLYFINCSQELQKITKKAAKRERALDFNFDFEQDPYLAISIFHAFVRSPDLSNFEFSTCASSQGKCFLEAYIYDISSLPKSLITAKLQEMQSSSTISPKFPTEILKFNQTETPSLESQSLSQIFQKTWETTEKELYKVTEYNESLECSDSGEIQMHDVSLKLSGSIVDKFPKISIASLSISDGSFQNVYDIYRKSYLEYVEPLEVINCYSAEVTDGESNKNHRQSPFDVTTNGLTMSESNAFKQGMETKTEYCSCPKCGIF